jgi:hypothetical protein
LLLDYAEAVLDRLGAQDVMIGVLAGNDDALRFYVPRAWLRPSSSCCAPARNPPAKHDDRSVWAH